MRVGWEGFYHLVRFTKIYSFSVCLSVSLSLPLSLSIYIYIYTQPIHKSYVFSTDYKNNEQFNIWERLLFPSGPGQLPALPDPDCTISDPVWVNLLLLMQRNFDQFLSFQTICFSTYSSLVLLLFLLLK